MCKYIFNSFSTRLFESYYNNNQMFIVVEHTTWTHRSKVSCDICQQSLKTPLLPTIYFLLLYYGRRNTIGISSKFLNLYLIFPDWTIIWYPVIIIKPVNTAVSFVHNRTVGNRVWSDTWPSLTVENSLVKLVPKFSVTPVIYKGTSGPITPVLDRTRVPNAARHSQRLVVSNNTRTYILV